MKKVTADSPLFWHYVALSLLTITAVVAVAGGHAFFLDFKADPRMVLQPWLLQNGFVQYVHIADEHAPLLPQLLAWLSPLFAGDPLLTARAVHAFFVSLTVILVLVWVANRASLWAAVASGIFLWRWSPLFGFGVLWHNLVLSPLYFLFLIMLTSSRPHKEQLRALVLGILAGIGILLKQHAILLVGIYLLFAAWQVAAASASWRRLFRLSALHMAGVAAPVAAYLLFYLHQGGRLSAFLYWNVLFNLESNYAVLGRLLPRYYDVILMTPAFILLPPFLLTLRPSFHDDPRSQSRLLLLLLLLAALVYQYPRYSGGHWPIALPLIAALSGLVCNDLLQIEGPRRLFRGVFLAFVLLWLLQGVASYWPYWSGQASQEIARVDELKQLAIEVDAHLAPDDTLAIVPNNEAVDNLYYLLQRRPPRYWVMHYRWFANERTISRSIAALEEERPETILYFEQHARMLDAWTELAAYVREKYEKEAQIMWDGYPLHIMRRRTTQ